MKKRDAKTWESKKEFKEEVYLYANRIKTKVRQITLRPMTNKWASCSTKGVFTFNTELLGLERSLGEYVWRYPFASSTPKVLKVPLP